MQHLDSILVFLETTSKKEPLCFERAITIAVMTGAKLVIAGIVPFWDEFFRLTSDKNAQRQTQETIQASIKDYLEPFKIRAKKAGVSTKIRLLEGPIALALLDEMIEHKHALLIKDETKEGEVRELFLMGKPSSVIAHHCNTNKADTLVIGTVGRAGLDGFLIGNTAERVLHQVSCSILAVKPQRIPSPITRKRLKR
jgi:nucleotide-binding universal stress UspA family protein